VIVSMDLPALTTNRLLIRSLRIDDQDAVERLYADIAQSVGNDWAMTRAQVQRWLEWSVLSYGELARLHQPPYGDRAISLRETDRLIGICGFVPCLDAFGQLPSFAGASSRSGERLNSTAFGLYWAVAPSQQRRGYATEAGRALIDHAFGRLKLDRIVATTTYNNVASIGVMQKLGMQIDRNPYPDPPWLQVVGVLSHPSLRGTRVQA
jgi:RimJ/RimL family protein N-acetyltransferase